MATAAFANPVISVLATPPGSPVDGDRYLVAASGTSGVFVGKENQVAERSSGAWVFSGAPAAGQQLSVGQLLLQYNAGWKLSPANVFDTVTALLAATAAYGLADGVSFRCAGRASAKDGGGADFYYDASDSSTADNGGTVRVDGASHRLKAKVIDPRQLPAIFGMAADGTTDDKTAFQAMVNWAYAQKIRDVYLPRGDIALSGSVFVPYGIMVRGQLSGTDPSRPATRIVTRTSASYTNGVMLGFNTADNSTQSANANYYGGGMQDVCFYDVANLKTAKGIAVFGNNYEFRNVGGRFMLQILKRGGLPTYSDNLHLFNPYYSDPVDPAVPQFEISGSGDGLIIDGGNFPPDQTLAISLVFYTQGACFGGVIRQCINGSMYIDARNITIENWHAENSTLKVGADAYVKVVNSNIGEDIQLTVPVFQMVDSIEGGNSGCLELDNVSFRWAGVNQFTSTCPFDISIGQQSRLVIRNSRRVVNGIYGLTTDCGLRISQDDKTTPVPGWASYADLLSRDGEIMPGYNVVLDHIIPAAANTYVGPWSAGISPASAGVWKIATGTYYYRAVRMYDVEKRIGKTGTNAEVSVAVSNTSSFVIISAYSAQRTAGAGPVQGMTRFYRGTASGSYNAYADVPMIAPDPALVMDDGNYIGGVPWISRTASGIDTIYPPDMTVPWRVSGVGLLQNGQPIVTSPGNAAATLGVASEQQVIYGAALTAARAVTLPALGRKGDKVRITRTAAATGAFNMTVAYGSGGGSTATIAAPTAVAFADFEYNGTYWDLTAKSTI